MKKIDQRKVQEAVALVLFHHERSHILLIQRRDIPVWTLPGGGIDPDETPEQAALRELEEETGLQGRLVRKVAEYLPIEFFPLNLFTQKTHVFEVAIESGTLQVTAETSSIQFFPLHALPKKTAPPYPLWIKEAFLNKNTLIQKRIEGVSLNTLLYGLFCHPMILLRFLLTKLGIHWNRPLSP